MLSRFAQHLALVAVTLWVGGMWTVGYLVAPVLFDMLSDRTLAGRVAGRLFDVVGWFGLGTTTYLLLVAAVRMRWAAFRSGLFWLVLALLVIVAAGQFGIQPLMAELKANAWPRDVMNSVMRDRFATWHGISSVLYLIQSVLGAMLVFALRRTP
ncbi:MAG: DUF4149 domain-containing protein [Betaproteobacteria bacterium]|nr:MAG: DUF4149 domain-containing protein [Betaproteobacteria bacterium]